MLTLLTILCLGCATSDDNRPPDPSLPMGQVREDAYGPGINSDATGRAFRWVTPDGQDPLGPVRRDVYGPGIGSDATGRPIHAEPLR